MPCVQTFKGQSVAFAFQLNPEMAPELLLALAS